MDTKLQFLILQEHGKHIRQLSADLSETLTKFEQVACDSAGATAPEAARLLGEVANLNNSLFSVADLFYKRLRVFIETRNIGSGSTSGK